MTYLHSENACILCIFLRYFADMKKYMQTKSDANYSSLGYVCINVFLILFSTSHILMENYLTLPE